MGYMKERFDGIERTMSDVSCYVHEHESRLATVETRCTTLHAGDGENKGIMRSPKTYAVGGIGTAVGMIVLELMRYLGQAPK